LQAKKNPKKRLTLKGFIYKFYVAKPNLRPKSTRPGKKNQAGSLFQPERRSQNL